MNDPHSHLQPGAKAQSIVDGVLRRRRNGERVSDEQVLQAYPDLRSEIKPLLAKAQLVARAAASAQQPGSADAGNGMGLEQLVQKMNQDLSGSSLDATPLAPMRTVVESREVPDDTDSFPKQSDSGRKTVSEDQLPADEKHVIDVDLSGSEDDVAPPTPVRPPARVLKKPKEDGTVEIAEPAAPLGETTRYRPSMRPPLGLLRVLDDDGERGELVRIRKAEFTIGREEGDLVIAHDLQISATQASIVRVDSPEGSTWHLQSLKAKNGIFVRVRRISLRGGDCIMLANSLVRFVPAVGREPSRLESLTLKGINDILHLTGDEHWIGRDQSVCEPFLRNNPMIDARMACVSRDPDDGRWTIRCTDSLNGMWERVRKTELKQGSMFQLGEQRFTFDIS